MDMKHDVNAVVLLDSASQGSASSCAPRNYDADLAKDRAVAKLAGEAAVQTKRKRPKTL